MFTAYAFFMTGMEKESTNVTNANYLDSGVLFNKNVR
jgi:hypothetical protein